MTSDARERPVALITGASSGIGAACATHLARSGFDIVANYRSNADGAAATGRACEALEARAVSIQGDVAQDSDCKNLIAETLSAFGQLDVLINNAGATKFVGANDLDGLSRDDFERLTAINVAGTYQMIRAARSALEQSAIASVVNVSSQSGMSGIGSSIAYAASKGALNTMTLSLARTLAPRIRVNAVCPGFVDTPWHSKADQMTEERLDAFRSRMTETAPLQRLTTAEDVAETIGWFATGGRAVTGHLLTVDSGTHLTTGSPI